MLIDEVSSYLTIFQLVSTHHSKLVRYANHFPVLVSLLIPKIQILHCLEDENVHSKIFLVFSLNSELRVNGELSSVSLFFVLKQHKIPPRSLLTPFVSLSHRRNPLCSPCSMVHVHPWGHCIYKKFLDSCSTRHNARTLHKKPFRCGLLCIVQKITLSFEMQIAIGNKITKIWCETDVLHVRHTINSSQRANRKSQIVSSSSDGMELTVKRVGNYKFLQFKKCRRCRPVFLYLSFHPHSMFISASITFFDVPPAHATYVYVEILNFIAYVDDQIFSGMSQWWWRWWL